MIEKTRIKLNALLRSSRKAQISVALLSFCFIAAIALYIKANTILVEIDGEEVRLTTLSSTVGETLERSRLKVYPEDIIRPARTTIVTDNLKVKVTRSLPVTITVDGKAHVARTPAETVGLALDDLSERLELNLKDTDEVNWDLDDLITTDMELIVHRSVPIRVKVDGKELATELAPRTVEETLEKMNIVLGDKDKVSLPRDQVIKANDEIQIVRVTEEIKNVTNDIPYQRVFQSGDFPIGLPDRIVKKGVNGVHEQVVRVTYEDGQEVDRTVLKQRVIRAPENQIVSRGSRNTISRGGQTLNFKKAYRMRATAYTGGGITATGHNVHYGVVAVDPRVIPLGSKLYIEGYGEATALDTGGAIKGNSVDLYMNTKAAALSWGVRSVTVYVK